MGSLETLTAAAETEWLDRWAVGPTEAEGLGLLRGTAAPDLALEDHTGERRSLSEFWEEGPALILFWRHFGCTCGFERAKRLVEEYPDYEAAGLTVVIVTQGEPARAAAYRDRHQLPCPVLCDPDHRAYRAFGIGQWSAERVLFDAPAEYWSHPKSLGESFQNGRRAEGRAPVDDPWRGVGEFVVATDGLVRLSYSYQYCEDFPDPRVITTAARLS